ncbi:MAG: endonuclease VII domain-containing protein [Nitrososphaera sp.]|nr:endonuclease VII domain-containing protein [Nitrososphaera sp.]
MPPVKKGKYGPRGDRSKEYTPGKAAYMKAWRKRNREKVNAYNRKSRQKRRFFWKRYSRIAGLGGNTYKHMLSQQDNACAICKKSFVKTPSIDHDHKTGAFRGLLCSLCNLAIGKLGDDPSRLATAAGYCASDGTPHASSRRFYELLGELAILHSKKQADYGREDDPFANIRASQEWGVPAWVGALVRLNDKVRRLQNFARKGALRNESAEDSMRDIAVYAIISLVLYEQEGQATKEENANA